MAKKQHADKRSVSTDALETLGTAPLGASEARDAIHLAVEPVIAGERLYPGQDIGLVLRAGELVAVRTSKLENVPTKALGIVDPFLEDAVYPGDRFWLVVYPRQIKSLRHVWEHPDFPSSGETVPAVVPAAPALAPRVIVADLAKELGVKAGDVIKFLYHNCSIAATLTQDIDEETANRVRTGFPNQDVVAAREYIEREAERFDLTYEQLIMAAESYLSRGSYLIDGGRYEGMYLDDKFWDHYEVVTGTTVAPNERGSFFSCSC